MISYYKNILDKNFEEADPEMVMRFVMSDSLRDQVMYLRSIGKNEYKIEKKRLPAVTWSGVFQPGTRSIESIAKYSGLVVLDIDHLDISKIEVLKQQFSGDEYVRFCFISPSNAGIKIIVQVNTSAEHHRAAWLHLQDVFEKKYLVKVDQSGKDVSRLCFLSWDPQAYINPGSSIFQVDAKYGEIVTVHTPQASGARVIHDGQRAWEVVKKWVENGKLKYQYTEGNRNNYIHAMACALNRVGVVFETAVDLINTNLQTPDQIWVQSVRSAYFHNQNEHGSYPLRDLGATEFVPPPFITDVVDDLAAKDLMNITAMLHHYKVPNQNVMDVVLKLARYYERQGFIDLKVYDPYLLMNNAIQALQQNVAHNASAFALGYMNAEDLAVKLVGRDISGALPTYLSWFDEALGGGIMPGTVYGLIGFGGTYKSIFAQYMAYNDALNDIPTLYVNGEMSEQQYFERLVLVVLGLNFRLLLSNGTLNKDNMVSFQDHIKAVTKNNMQVYSGSGFTKQQILATIDHIYATTGKRIKRIYIDGLAQFDWGGREEIMANISNSFVVKDLAKEANNGEGAVVIPLIHCSGEENKVIRNTGTRIRGGSKVLTNLDGYFCTSLLIDQDTLNEENPDDFGFLSGKMYLRMVDKRSGANETSAIINIKNNLHLEIENSDPRSYEVKMKKQQRS